MSYITLVFITFPDPAAPTNIFYLYYSIYPEIFSIFYITKTQSNMKFYSNEVDVQIESSGCCKG